MAGLAAVLGIEQLLAARCRIGAQSVSVKSLRIETRRLVCRGDVVAKRLDLLLTQIELGHTANQGRPQRVWILEKVIQPRALYRAAFPGQIGRHVASIAVDGVAAQAAEIVHNPSSLAAGMVVRRPCVADDQFLRIISSVVRLCQQRGGKRVNLRFAQRELGHLQSGPE